ncbi:hypothetical protein RYX36_008753 [Vicia faba]
MSKFSQPSGNPACFEGKLSVTWILRLEETAREITEEKRDAFFGVVKMSFIEESNDKQTPVSEFARNNCNYFSGNFNDSSD